MSSNAKYLRRKAWLEISGIMKEFMDERTETWIVMLHVIPLQIDSTESARIGDENQQHWLLFPSLNQDLEI